MSAQVMPLPFTRPWIAYREGQRRDEQQAKENPALPRHPQTDPPDRDDHILISECRCVTFDFFLQK
jgi:hypothetical protein